MQIVVTPAVDGKRDIAVDAAGTRWRRRQHRGRYLGDNEASPKAGHSMLISPAFEIEESASRHLGGYFV